jgi:GNAT superfamily N-acetyltransferase
MLIRLADIDDAVAISHLITPLAKTHIAHEFSPEGATNLLSSMTVEAIEEYLGSGYRYHVALDGGRLVGVVGVRDNKHLYHLFVAEAYQGQGLARELWSVAKEACLEAGNPGEFTVNSSRFALGMYKTFGFTESGPPENNQGVIYFPMTYTGSMTTKSRDRRRTMPPTDISIADAYFVEARTQLAKASDAIRHCLSQLTDAQISWRPHDSMNSIGNLVLHVCGNIRQWIIAGVGGEPDVRDRPKEFAERGPFGKEDLLRHFDQLVEQADAVLRTLPPSQLLERRRIQGFDTTGLSAIFDSVAHFKGHTQEIVCLTRMQLGDTYRFEWVPSTPEEGAPAM